ncbi:MAG: hypothetical protein WCF57_11495 [Pyrinomonadaceae bacterium]
MKYHRIFLLPVLFALALSASAQDQHVRTEYMKDIKMTKVETDLMYVLNTPAQFAQVSLVSRYKGEKLVKPPTQITLSIWSTSKEALYRKEKDRKLLVKTDGEEWSLETTTHLVMKGETKGGKDTFYSENRPALGMQIPVPMSATVRNGDNVNGLFMELMHIEMKPEQFAKIANAKKVEFRMGNTSFAFTEDQMNTVRDFAGRIKP